jgi:hypothetical protein
MTAATPGREELLARAFPFARQWGASDTVVPMLAAFAQAEIDRLAAKPADDPIPAGIYFNVEQDNFYWAADQGGRGNDFFKKWKPRWREFPQSREVALSIPTVRGDRESLTDLRNSFVEICRSTDVRSGSNDPYANRIANEAIKSIDAILSLPVQPGGAGEREAARILRGWAKAYRDTPEHRFPSDPNAEFFPVDLENAADLLDPRQAPHSGSGDGR